MYFIQRLTSDTRHLTNDCTRTLCGVDCGRDTGFLAPIRIDPSMVFYRRVVIDEPNVCLPCCSTAGLPDPTPAVPLIKADHVEILARALCRAEGKNPNIIVPAFNDPNRQVGGGDMFMGETHEQWREYEQTARRFIVMFRAIQGML